MVLYGFTMVLLWFSMVYMISGGFSMILLWFHRDEDGIILGYIGILMRDTLRKCQQFAIENDH